VAGEGTLLLRSKRASATAGPSGRATPLSADSRRAPTSDTACWHAAGMRRLRLLTGSAATALLAALVSDFSAVPHTLGRDVVCTCVTSAWPPATAAQGCASLVSISRVAEVGLDSVPPAAARRARLVVRRMVLLGDCSDDWSVGVESVWNTASGNAKRLCAARLLLRHCAPRCLPSCVGVSAAA
jgi:hypothetical protein